jgi:predicted Ser/Thr protein kinase
MHPEVPDEELLSWVERGAPELDRYLRDHPEAIPRVRAWRAAIGGVRAAALVFPERIAGLRILRVLGRGGMGVVYEAEQELPRRRVALKVLPGALDPAALKRFERECEALGRLAHPSIARLFQAGRTEAGEPFLVMELVEGRPLADRMLDALWPVRERLAFFAELCEAVAAAHAAGVVHRDLKPGNVLVDGAGRPKVVDFGLALLREGAASRVTLPGAALGTLAWASPEQLRGRQIDARADVWSLGVLIFELLTGRRPFREAEGDVAALVRAVSEDEAPAPSRHDAALRGDLDAIVARALARNPARRYPDAAALADDVRRHLDRRPISARPISRAARAARFVWRHRTASAALLLATAGVVAGFTLSGGEAAAPDFSRPLVGDGYVEVAPYAALRWRGTTPEVEVDGRFFELVAIDSLRADLMVAYCRQTGDRRWVKRFTEDLGQVIERMTGRSPPELVTLTLRDPESGAETRRREVPMTAENRRELWESRGGTPFEEARESEGRIEVRLDGAWHELLSAGGVEAAALRAALEARSGKDGVKALAGLFCDAFEESLDRPTPRPLELKLRSLDDGQETIVADAPFRRP